MYREALASIVRDGVIDTVGDRRDRAKALWFIMPGPLLRITGRLLADAARE
jgi:Family of unknown function (DUF6463)